MLKYKKIILAFCLLLMVILLIDYYYPVGIWWYIGIVIAAAGMLAYGSISIRSGFYCRVICSVDSGDKVIALTFDDGPDEQVTPQVLDLLNRFHIKAAFFCVGSRILKYPALIERMDNDGHIIGNHSFSHHLFFDLFSAKKMEEELVKTEKLVERIVHKKLHLFRPPYGVTNPMLARALRKMNYSVIGWTIKSKDTVIRDEQKIFNRLTGKLGNTGIILFHDTSLHLVPVLDRFIKYAQENEIRIERLDKILQIDAYE
jgi:peptidoglycan/xylan/chitin deacetylase (PgdA/CDA1 family)